MATRIKMCGMTRASDIALAVQTGADAIGVIIAPSARRVDLATLASLRDAIPAHVEAVAVVVDPTEAEAAFATQLAYTLQFSGDESAQTCERLARGRPYIKAFHLDPQVRTLPAALGAGFAHAMWMFDTRVDGRYGGTGASFAWDAILAVARERAVVVSGGLTPDNVADCVRRVRPGAVDVRNGIETDGFKDERKMRAFVRAVRDAERSGALAPGQPARSGNLAS